MKVEHYRPGIDQGQADDIFADSEIPFDTPQDSQDSHEAQEFHDSKDFRDGHDLHDSQDSKGKTERLKGLQLDNSSELRGLPLEEYLGQLLEYCARKEKVTNGYPHSPLFHFARFCKGHPSIKGLPDHEASAVVEKIMFDWVPPGSDPWEFFFPRAADGDGARLDFMKSWLAVRYVPFEDILSKALALAEAKPLQPTPRRTNLYTRFVSLAGWLQVLMRGQAIFLASRTVGLLLRCDQRTASTLCNLAIRDGFLTITKMECFRLGGKSEAREYIFAVERFPELEAHNDGSGEVLAVR
jgi:hypothetical protein